MADSYQFYLRLPTALQNLAVNCEGWRLQRRRYGAGFDDLLREVEARESWGWEQWIEFRDRRLSAFVREVACRSPFYRQRFRQAGLDPQRVTGLSDLLALPVLTKTEVKDRLHEIVPEGLRLGPLITVHTSGTTGSGLCFKATRQAEQEQWAIWWRYRRWHGIDLDTWCGYFGGRLIASPRQKSPPFWRVNYPGRQILFSPHHMTPANLPYYVEELRRREPPWLHGYPSLLVLLARYLLERGETLGYPVRWVTTGAEILSPEHAALLESAFGVRPRQHYGLAEAVANFSECEYGCLHVDEDFAAVEFIPTGDGRHRVVGTNFSNPATPLIRYDTGDLVALGEACCCGRPGRVVKSIEGRTNDFLRLRDGRLFGPANHLFKYMVNVREGQIYQPASGEVVVRIVPSSAFTAEDEHALRREIQRRLGEGEQVRIECVDVIERSPSGKLRVVVSELGGGGEVRIAAAPNDMPRLRVYSALPASLQDLACSLEGWRIARRRYSRRFWELLEQAEARCFWSPEQIREFCDARLRSFLAGPVASTPFYREVWRKLGIGPEQIRSLEDLKILPVLTKQDVKRNLSAFRSGAVREQECLTLHTSGTTGSGLCFKATRQAEQEQWAIWWRYRRWHCIDLGTWCGYFGGRPVVPAGQDRPPFWRFNYPGRQIMFSAYHLSARTLPAYLDALRRRRPPWLHGYPSVLALLAAYLLETGGDLGYQVRWVTTGAENLLPQQADLIQRAFGVRPRQHYGMAEAVANFSECELGRLHVDEDFAAVEFLPTGDGHTYRVVGTNLSNPATPLVRYDVGDVVTLASGTCPCGRPGRLVERVDGRQEDYVVLRDGTRVGRMDHIFKDMLRIREAQIYQAQPGEIVYRIVRGSGYRREDEQRLLEETQLRLGDRASVRIEYVDCISRGPSGKLRFVVSEIAGARLA